MRSYRQLVVLVIVGLAVVLLLLPPVLAQAAKSSPPVAAREPTVTQAPVREGISWEWVMRSGGWLMYVLGALSVVTVAFIIYFFLVVRESQVAPAVLRRDLREKIEAGLLDDARRICDYRPCALSALALTAMDYLRAVPEADAALLKDVVEGEGARQAEALQGQIQYLLDIGVIAPMVGLLGTVVGMLKAFSAVALDIARAKPIVLAAGVSQALVTTVAGLCISIPAMLFYAYFRRRVSNLISQLEMAGVDILTALLRGKIR
ncbi:MAG: MotA/TolQ/ExbB proton channel family protein [Kiritimatiellae bacterium]|nr:MotA/TolQ/ExbB proton channel family protein [Kiritimatiellia bacterium]